MPPETYLHSDIQEIMVTKPSFVLKWGNVLIASLALLLLAFTMWFKYPDFITTDVSLFAQRPGATPLAASPYVAVGTIGREQYASVRPGQQVLVQVHELGSTTLVGQVLTVAPLARHYRHDLVIQLAPSTSYRLYPSFSGSARIMLQQQSLLTKFLAR